MDEFIESYFCFSISSSQSATSQLQDGNRIVMPESALQRLINRNIDFPYFFRITKYNSDHNTDDDDGDDKDEWNFSDHDSDYSLTSDEENTNSKTQKSDYDQKQSSDDDNEENEELQNSPIVSGSDEVKENDLYSHCGVSEFTSEDGTVVLPQWIMSNLGLQNGDSVLLRSVKLESGNYVKLNPINANFLNIPDLKAVLETKLRSFACLTPGDVIPIFYNNVTYNINVLETKPSSSGISIIETDCEVELLVPLQAQAPTRAPTPAQAPDIAVVCKKEVEKKKTEDESEIKFTPFSGMGRRLDGVEVVRDEIEGNVLNSVVEAKRQTQCRKVAEEEDTITEKINNFQAFTGKSRTLLDN